MALARQTQYLPHRLRRWGTRRVNERIRKGQTVTIPSSALRKMIAEARNPNGIEIDPAAITALGAADSNTASGAAINTTNLPNANRIQPLTARIVGFNSDNDANGNILSCGDGTDGFAVWMVAGSLVNVLVVDGANSAGAIIQLDPSIVTDELWILIAVNPLFVAVGIRDGTGPIRFGGANQSPGGAAMAPDASVGIVLGADANAVSGVTGAPADGLSGTSCDLWLNADLLA